MDLHGPELAETAYPPVGCDRDYNRLSKPIRPSRGGELKMVGKGVHSTYTVCDTVPPIILLIAFGFNSFH